MRNQALFSKARDELKRREGLSLRNLADAVEPNRRKKVALNDYWRRRYIRSKGSLREAGYAWGLLSALPERPRNLGPHLRNDVWWFMTIGIIVYK